jgi:predicted membrane-bound spermidine synthase
VFSLAAFGGAYDLLLSLRDGGPSLFAHLLRTDLRLMGLLCVLTVLPAALLMGAIFPAAARLWAAGADQLGSRLGGVYGANVAGAILGSLAGGFLLVPLLGAHASLLLLAALNVLLGAWLLRAARLAIPATAALGLLSLALVGWGLTRPPVHTLVFREHFPDQQLLAYWEGLENTVSVGRGPDGILTLFTNSRGQTNDSPDLVRYHRVMGHLAALLSPHPNRVLVVGLGAGATPAAIAEHSGTQLDIVELSPAVISAAPAFAAINQNVLSLPNVHLTVDDGRNYLLRARQPFDIITADIIHPFDAGATNLYSVEYFRLVERALAPDGLMVQWVSPGSAFEHQLIVRTFLQAFPHATLWLAGDLLVGSPSPIHLSRAELAERLADPAAQAGLAEVGLLKPQDVLTHFRANTDELRAYVGDGPILTDDRPLLEYFRSLSVPLTPADLDHFSSDPSPIIDS